ARGLTAFTARSEALIAIGTPHSDTYSDTFYMRRPNTSRDFIGQYYSEIAPISRHFPLLSDTQRYFMKLSVKVLKIPVSAVRFRPWPPSKINHLARVNQTQICSLCQICVVDPARCRTQVFGRQVSVTQHHFIARPATQFHQFLQPCSALHMP